MEQKEKFLTNAAFEAKIDIEEKEQKLFGIYIRELKEWNKKTNITSINKMEDIVIKHFLDSLMVLKYVELFGRVVDIGSGGGFPGIPIKIMKPSLQVMLIESNRRKANFLRHIIRILNLKEIEVFNGRVEEYKPLILFDFAISRAFASLKSFCIISIPLLKTGGYIISMKGKKEETLLKNQEIRKLGLKIINRYYFNLPQEKGKRNIFIIRKCFT